ncbi:TIGR04255 family protein [uncultured Salipiger sp.]|uniref:TIGR04255 family protein n=1 Tax=uncultured Salipiger sp. TaxID=499810 RepID=UPI0025958F74|nr:TIGR04255 family protein [uncultured Salipiger sp.]
MTWTPVQQRHAIERVRFEVAFTESLPARVVDSAKRTFEQVRNDVRFEEPTHQEYHQFLVGRDAALSRAGKGTDGWLARRKLASGLIAEAVTLNSTTFSYETTDYRDWGTAYRRFEKIAAKIIEQIATVVDFRSVAHDYVDRFVFQGFPKDAKPTDIFVPALLAPLNEGARSGRFLWHIHHGWFEDVDGRSILVNQNFDAQDGQTPTGTDVRSLQILTKAEFRPKPDQFSVVDLEVIVKQLHDICNERFSSVLTDDAKKMIGLEV